MQTFGLIVGAWTEGVGGPMGGGKGGDFTIIPDMK